MILDTQMTVLIWNKALYDLSKEFSTTTHAQNLYSVSLMGSFSWDWKKGTSQRGKFLTRKIQNFLDPLLCFDP